MFDMQMITENNILKVNLNGSLDISGVDLLEDKMSEIEFSALEAVQFNMENIEFIDSTGIGSLLNLTRSLEERGLRFEITNVNEDIREIFRILDLEELLGETKIFLRRFAIKRKFVALCRNR